jgi:hypothetical protein
MNEPVTSPERAPRPGGPSAKSFHRVGSSTHQRNTSEESPMVEPIPLSRPAPVADTAFESPDQDLHDLALAEYYQDLADALRQQIVDRALWRWLFGPQGVAR